MYVQLFLTNERLNAPTVPPVVLRHHDNRRPPPRNVNAPWLIERGQAHASLGWDIPKRRRGQGRL